MDAKKRALELLGEGLTHLAIPAVLKQEGFLTSEGNDFSPTEILEMFGQLKKRETEEPEIPISRPSEMWPMLNLDELGIPDGFMPHEGPYGAGGLPDAWRPEIRAMIRAELASMPGNFNPIPVWPFDMHQPPPEAMGTHSNLAQPGPRTKIGATVDANLAQALERWRSEQGISLDRALDLALWQFFKQLSVGYEPEIGLRMTDE